MGTKICSNELIFHAQIEEKIPIPLVKTKINLIKYNGRKLSFKIIGLKIELTAWAKILKLRFGHLNMSL